MTLYQEMPKRSIISTLKQKFSEAELDMVKGELSELLTTCNTFDELQSRLSYIVRDKLSRIEFKRMNEGNFIGI